jgi:hypothetical protein
MLWCILYIDDIFFKEKLKSQYLVVFSKFFKLSVFGQILTKFDSFEQFWTDSTTMAMADSMPPFQREKRKRHNFCKKCHNLAYDGLLESPLNFPCTKKVSKNPITN